MGKSHSTSAKAAPKKASAGAASEKKMATQPPSAPKKKVASQLPSAPTTPPPVSQICIVGGGNSSHVLAALLGHARDNGSKIKVNMFAPFADEAERLKAGCAQDRGITLENPDGSTTKGSPDVISKNAADVVPGSQIVILPLPTFALPDMFSQIADHLDNGAWVGVLPGQGGFQWIAGSFLDTHKDGKGIVLFGSDKLPYNCRIHEYGKSVKVYAYKEKIGIATIPGTTEMTNTVTDALNKHIPKLQVHTLPNMLSVTLAPANQCIHPARMYGLFNSKDVKQWSTPPLFYEEMDQASADMIQAVSDDIQTLSHAFEHKSKLDMSTVLDVKTALVNVYEIGDSSSTLSAFQTCEGFKGISTPMKEVKLEGGKDKAYEFDFGCRYFTEDVPALCVLYALSLLMDVKLPAVSTLIKWAQKKMPGFYQYVLEDGSINNDRGKVMYTPQFWGINTAEELLAFHRTGEMQEGSAEVARKHSVSL